MSVFGTDTGAPLVIKSDKAIVKIDGKTLLATGVNITYQRNVGIVPVLNKKRVVAVGEGQGQITAETMLISSAEYDITTAAFLKGDGCKPKELEITFEDGQCETKTKKVKCYGCVASSVSVGMQGGRGYVLSGVGITFTALDI